MTETYLSIDGLRIAYRTYGNPHHPPLILIHGVASHGGVWRHTVAALADAYFCVTVDLLGHGGSDKPRGGDYRIATQARRVLAVADALGLETFGLFGHSMGGQIAMTIASTLAPERVTALVNVSGVATGKLLPANLRRSHLRAIAYFWMPWLLDVSVRLLPMPGLIDWTYGMWFANAVPEEWIREDMALTHLPGQHNTYLPVLEAVAHADLTDRLPHINAPTLIIFGRDDQVVPPSDGDLAHRLIPNSQMVWLNGIGHFPMIEDTPAYLAAVTTMFKPEA
ncbi:MAG: alpha/beta hydrolase [bacterium]|nr:alpha/beta hydrolase [bacterium]